MAKLSLRPTFIIDSIKVLFKKSPKVLLFGEQASLDDEEKEAIDHTLKNFDSLKDSGGRRGMFNKVDVVHKGTGHAYLVADPSDSNRSFLVLGDDFKVTSGPDLYAYLITGDRPKESIGEFIDLGELKGTKESQVYIVDKPIEKLSIYKSAAIYCKQFQVLFSSAELR